MNAAVIGGGYAGMAAAVTLAAEGVPVTVYEAGKILGGRARRVEQAGTTLDNGLHILIGAYRETLRLMRLVGADPARLLLRAPFQWRIHGELALTAAPLPAPFHLVAGLIRARGVPLAERLAAARFLATMTRARFRLDADTSVSRLLEAERQGDRLTRLLWHPLCLAALNTAPETASAQVFLNVLRDSVAAGTRASDILLPRCDLSALFPDLAAQWLRARGGTVLLGRRVTAIDDSGNGYAVRCGNGEQRFDCVVCAVAPQQLKTFAGNPALAVVVQKIARFEYEPIHSVYLQYPVDTRLPAPMLGFRGSPMHWAFDRGALAGQRGLIGAVISARGAHEAEPHDSLARLVDRALSRALGALPAPLWSRVIAEQRATFSCKPGLERPGHRTARSGLALAGDYTAGDYPATLEAAVRSGIAAARLLLDEGRAAVTPERRSV